MQRIFVSIDIPEKLKDIAENYLKDFYKTNLAKVGERKNWHITVAFCGYLNDGELNKLKDLTEKTAKETKTFELIPDKIIFKNKRMVWLTFENSPEFQKLNKEQIPHLTLVRFKEEHYSNLKRFLPKEGIDLKNIAEPFLIDSINIMESYLSPLGPKYELLEKFNLS